MGKKGNESVFNSNIIVTEEYSTMEKNMGEKPHRKEFRSPIKFTST
jgi:hypothetical protein